MGFLSIWHWLIVLVIVMMVFGTKKLRDIGRDLGGAIKNFKDGMEENEGALPKEDPGAAKELRYSTTIDVQSKDASNRKAKSASK